MDTSAEVFRECFHRVFAGIQVEVVTHLSGEQENSYPQRVNQKDWGDDFHGDG